MTVDLEWPCMVCGEWRPDAQISVAYRQIAVLGEGLTFHVRYCNDRPGCAGYANAEGPWTGGLGDRSGPSATEPDGGAAP